MSVGLVMIVKDEETQLPACLATVRDHIDRWTIIDTGSSDRTPDVAREQLAGIPGQVIRRPFEGFGKTRTAALALSRVGSGYNLMVDADHRVTFTGDIPVFGADSYLVPVENAGLTWRLPLLTRRDRPFAYVGAAHAFLRAGFPGCVTANTDILTVSSARGGGAADPTKIQRDAELLEGDLADDPTNARAAFYLAQSYADLGRTEDALAMYQRRAQMGGWHEEVFWSLYRQGALLLQLDRFGDAVSTLLDAWNSRATRAEPLWLLAREHRRRGMLAVARMFATRAAEIPLPADRLFVLEHVYRTGVDEELVALGIPRPSETAVV